MSPTLVAALKKFLLQNGIWVILLIGFALRVTLVLQGRHLEVKWDEVAYVLRAREILTSLAGYQDVMRAPVYPFFLAGVFGMVGEVRFAVGVVQALVSTFLIASLYTLTRVLFPGKIIALTAALFTAFYFEFLTLARIMMSETLFMLLSVLGVLFLFHAYKTQRVWEFVVAGILIALASLTRELLSYFAVLVIPVWLVLVSFRQPRRMAQYLGVLLLGLFLVLAPWVARNWTIEQRFILSTMHSEIDLLRDNWRIELAAQNPPPPKSNLSMAKRVRQELAALPANQRSLYVFTRAIGTMVHYPVPWIQDKFSRIRSFWRPFALEARVVRLEDISEPWRSFLRQIVSYSVVALLLLGTFGILVARDDAPKLLIALYVLYSFSVFLMTHYLPRFRLPLLILLIPYAAFTIVAVARWLRAPALTGLTRSPWRTASVVVVLGLFLFLAYR